MMWWLALAAAADDASAEDVSEEIIVWQQPFARFDDKRWLVRSEVITPALTPLGTVKTPIGAMGWQLEAIVHCRLVDTKGSLREADCILEDAALRVHVPKARPDGNADVAIRAMAAELKGKNLQLQVNKKGRVPNTDVDGLAEDNQDERRLVTGVHTMMTQVSGAFHMDFPKRDPRGHTWVSYQEPLLMLASPRRGIGSQEVLHRVDVVDGRWILQTKGRSTSTSPLPNPDAGLPCTWPSKYGSCIANAQVYPDFLDTEMTYALDLSGVAVVDPDAGYPTERVWAVTGAATASSPGALGTTDYWSAGLLRELGRDEVVTLGASGLVAAPRARGSRRVGTGPQTGALPPWVPVATLPTSE
ncbi:MAG: hypothetical protein R3F61_25700 [Myxococcota bacterium]